MSSRILDDNQIFHAETAEYNVPIAPKTRDTYNTITNRFDTREDYSLKQLKNAEKGFLKLKEIFEEEYSNAFMIQQDKPMSRIANISSRGTGEQKIVQGWREVDLSLFTFSLQNGMVYNFPIAQLEKTFNIIIDPKKTMFREGGNKGSTLKQAIKFMSRTRELLSKIFEDKGYIMKDEDFAKILCLSRLYRSNIIVLNVDGWVEYIMAGKNLNTIMFGFDRIMFHSGKFPYIPVDEVDEYESLPREWLKSIFQTVQKKKEFIF